MSHVNEIADMRRRRVFIALLRRRECEMPDDESNEDRRFSCRVIASTLRRVRKMQMERRTDIMLINHPLSIALSPANQCGVRILYNHHCSLAFSRLIESVISGLAENK